MGCKQCRFFLFKHHINNYTPSNPIEQNIISVKRNEPSAISSNVPEKKLSTLDNLPVELIYYIFDQLDTYTILTSIYNVCTRLNSIIYTYDRFNLNLKTISMNYFHRICSIIRPEQIISLTLSDRNDNIGLVEIFLKKFHLESLKRLQSLTLVNIDDNEQMIKILLSITNQLQILSIENTNEYYNDTVMDILMSIIGKEYLHTLSLNIERNRILNPLIIWPRECFLYEIKLVGLCHISLFRNILRYSFNLKIFQAYDIDLDDEWIDEDEDEEIEQSQMLPLSHTSNLISLSLVNARNEMDRLEWLIPQFTELKYFKYLNVYDFHIETIYENDYSLLDGECWEKILCNCNQFEFISTIHLNCDTWNIHHYLASFRTKFWQDKNWNIVLEQYNKTVLIYSLPYIHNTYYYDRTIFVSIPHNPLLLNQSMENVTKLRINLTAVNNLGKQIVGHPRFSHVSHLILDGQWRTVELANSIASLVCLSNIITLIRLERVPTFIFQSFIYDLTNLQSLTLTTFVLDSMNAAVFQYLQCLHSLNIVQLHDNYRHFVNVEPFCTMFPQIKHLDIPVDNLDSCQYVIDRLEEFLISVIFRFPNNDDEDEDDDDDNDDDDNDEDDENDNHKTKSTELIEWAQNIRQYHQYRINDGDMYLWLQ
ncbi:unnamed protein product [Adineta steineri]|uniref:F-box domain-containing protein n=1 Tax=Adineta steineri TaxID=433720 RepID=A0A814WGD6_9BILA|nr:unnamed protein product [Adineta steineri]CAF3583075.1 unnamed protein product [Adineta steineri]